MAHLSLALVLIGTLLPAGVAAALQIGPEDFAAGSTILTFDEFANATFLSNEFESLGVVLGSGPTPDGLNGGGTPAPFVATENEFPLATQSAPNKIVGTINHPSQGLIKCQSCAVVVTFSHAPTQAGFWVSDPDLGQLAEFYGPSGLLDTLVVTASDPGTPFFLGFEDVGGITEIVLHSTAQFGVGLDNLQFTSLPEPSFAAVVSVSILLLLLRGQRRSAA